MAHILVHLREFDAVREAYNHASSFRDRVRLKLQQRELVRKIVHDKDGLDVIITLLAKLPNPSERVTADLRTYRQMQSQIEQLQVERQGMDEVVRALRESLFAERRAHNDVRQELNKSRQALQALDNHILAVTANLQRVENVMQRYITALLRRNAAAGERVRRLEADRAAGRARQQALEHHVGQLRRELQVQTELAAHLRQQHQHQQQQQPVPPPRARRDPADAAMIDQLQRQIRELETRLAAQERDPLSAVFEQDTTTADTARYLTKCSLASRRVVQRLLRQPLASRFEKMLRSLSSSPSDVRPALSAIDRAMQCVSAEQAVLCLARVEAGLLDLVEHLERTDGDAQTHIRLVVDAMVASEELQQTIAHTAASFDNLGVSDVLSQDELVSCHRARDALREIYTSHSRVRKAVLDRLQRVAAQQADNTMVATGLQYLQGRNPQNQHHHREERLGNREASLRALQQVAEESAGFLQGIRDGTAGSPPIVQPVATEAPTGTTELHQLVHTMLAEVDAARPAWTEMYSPGVRLLLAATVVDDLFPTGSTADYTLPHFHHLLQPDDSDLLAAAGTEDAVADILAGQVVTLQPQVWDLAAYQHTFESVGRQTVENSLQLWQFDAVETRAQLHAGTNVPAPRIDPLAHQLLRTKGADGAREYRRMYRHPDLAKITPQFTAAVSNAAGLCPRVQNFDQLVEVIDNVWQATRQTLAELAEQTDRLGKADLTPEFHVRVEAFSRLLQQILQRDLQRDAADVDLRNRLDVLHNQLQLATRRQRDALGTATQRIEHLQHEAEGYHAALDRLREQLRTANARLQEQARERQRAQLLVNAATHEYGSLHQMTSRTEQSARLLLNSAGDTDAQVMADALAAQQTSLAAYEQYNTSLLNNAEQQLRTLVPGSEERLRLERHVAELQATITGLRQELARLASSGPAQQRDSLLQQLQSVLNTAKSSMAERDAAKHALVMQAEQAAAREELQRQATAQLQAQIRDLERRLVQVNHESAQALRDQMQRAAVTLADQQHQNSVELASLRDALAREVADKAKQLSQAREQQQHEFEAKLRQVLHTEVAKQNKLSQLVKQLEFDLEQARRQRDEQIAAVQNMSREDIQRAVAALQTKMQEDMAAAVMQARTEGRAELAQERATSEQQIAALQEQLAATETDVEQVRQQYATLLQSRQQEVDQLSDKLVQAKKQQTLQTSDLETRVRELESELAEEHTRSAQHASRAEAVLGDLDHDNEAIELLLAQVHEQPHTREQLIDLLAARDAKQRNYFDALRASADDQWNTTLARHINTLADVGPAECRTYVTTYLRQVHSFLAARVTKNNSSGEEVAPPAVPDTIPAECTSVHVLADEISRETSPTRLAELHERLVAAEASIAVADQQRARLTGSDLMRRFSALVQLAHARMSAQANSGRVASALVQAVEQTAAAEVKERSEEVDQLKSAITTLARSAGAHDSAALAGMAESVREELRQKVAALEDDDARVWAQIAELQAQADTAVGSIKALRKDDANLQQIHELATQAQDAVVAAKTLAATQGGAVAEAFDLLDRERELQAAAEKTVDMETEQNKLMTELEQAKTQLAKYNEALKAAHDDSHNVAASVQGVHSAALVTLQTLAQRREANLVQDFNLALEELDRVEDENRELLREKQERLIDNHARTIFIAASQLARTEAEQGFHPREHAAEMARVWATFTRQEADSSAHRTLQKIVDIIQPIALTVCADDEKLARLVSFRLALAAFVGQTLQEAEGFVNELQAANKTLSDAHRAATERVHTLSQQLAEVTTELVNGEAANRLHLDIVKERLRAENADIMDQLSKAEAEAEKLRQQLDTAQNEGDEEEEGQAPDAEADIRQAKEHARLLREQLDALEVNEQQPDNSAEEEAEAAAAAVRIQELEARVTTAEEDRSEVAAELEQAKARLQLLENRLAAAAKEKEEAALEQTETKAALKMKLSTAEARIADLTEQLAVQEKEAVARQAEVQQQKGEVARLAASLDSTTAQIAQLESRLQQAGEDSHASQQQAEAREQALRAEVARLQLAMQTQQREAETALAEHTALLQQQKDAQLTPLVLRVSDLEQRVGEVALERDMLQKRATALDEQARAGAKQLETLLANTHAARQQADERLAQELKARDEAASQALDALRRDQDDALAALTAKLSEETAKREEITQRLAAAESEREKLASWVSNMVEGTATEEKLAALVQEVRQLRIVAAEHDQLVASLEQSRQETADLRASLDQLAQRSQVLDEEKASWSAERARLLSQFDNERARNEQYQRATADQAAAVQAAVRSRDTLAGQLMQQQAEMAALRDRHRQETQQASEAAAATINSLREQLQAAIDTQTISEDAKTSFSGEVAKLNATHDEAMEAMREKHASDMATLQTQLIDARTKLANAAAATAELARDAGATPNASLAEVIQTAAAKLVSQQENVQMLRTRVYDLESDRRTLRVTLNRSIEHSNKVNKEEYERNLALIAKTKRLQTQLLQQQTERAQLAEELAQKNGAIDDVLARFNQVQAQLTEERQQTARLQETLKQKDAENDEYIAGWQEIQAERQQLAEELNQLRARHDQLLQRDTDQQDEVARLKDALESQAQAAEDACAHKIANRDKQVQQWGAQLAHKMNELEACDPDTVAFFGQFGLQPSELQQTVLFDNETRSTCWLLRNVAFYHTQPLETMFKAVFNSSLDTATVHKIWAALFSVLHKQRGGNAPHLANPAAECPQFRTMTECFAHGNQCIVGERLDACVALPASS